MLKKHFLKRNMVIIHFEWLFIAILKYCQVFSPSRITNITFGKTNLSILPTAERQLILAASIVRIDTAGIFIKIFKCSLGFKNLPELSFDGSLVQRRVFLEVPRIYPQVLSIQSNTEVTDKKYNSNMVDSEPCG